MKLLFDLLPVILFFATYKLTSHDHGGGTCANLISQNGEIWQEPIFLATSVAIGATVLQVGWLLARGKKVDPMLWLSLAIISTFGGATLYFRNPDFIQWKPTILYWLLGSALALSASVWKKNLIRQALETQVKLPDPVWAKLNWAWVACMGCLGVANLLAMHWLSCDGWVNFKLYGLSGLMLLFVVGQGVALNRYFVEEETP